MSFEWRLRVVASDGRFVVWVATWSFAIDFYIGGGGTWVEKNHRGAVWAWGNQLLGTVNHCGKEVVVVA
jgi:hypothetical protein|uniref:Uncharacterized protein n=1 Tax=Fagus sylvatica TaxID=28930 RepID=A0A2N9GVF5_FAGSY